MATRPYHHLPDGRFRNPPGSPERDAPVREYLRFFAGRLRAQRVPIRPPEGHVLPMETARDAWRHADDADRWMWLGHASFLLQVGGCTLLVDPFLGPVAGPHGFGPRRFAPPGLPVDALPDLDALLITHNHYDHLDDWTIARLRNRDRVEVYVPLGLGRHFAGLGFRRVHELDWYESRMCRGAEITSLPAIHWSKRGIGDECRTLWCGYAISSPESRLYFSGDTGFGPVFDEIGARLGGFDLGLVGIGAYEPRSVMKASHATPEEAAAIADKVRARAVMGMHWGAVSLSEEDPFEPPVRFQAAAMERGFAPESVLRPGIGKTIRLALRGGSAAGDDVD